MQCVGCNGLGIGREGNTCRLCGGSGAAASGSADADGYEKVVRGFELIEDEDENEGRRYDFETKGAGIGAGAWFSIIFFGALIGLPLTFLFTVDVRSGETVFLTWLAFVAISFVIAVALHTMRSATHSFIITEEAVHTDGLRFRKEDISEILIRNNSGRTASQVQVRDGSFVAGTGATGLALVGASVLSNASRNIGANTGAAIQESLAKRGYAVCIRHGRNVVPLADNLDEDTATSLFRKIAEVF